MRTTILLAIAITAVAASRSENGKDGTWLGRTSTQSDAKHPGSVGGTAVVPDVSTGTTVVVLLEDRHIAVRQTAIPPGPAVFTVTNGGDQLHNLYIEGPGVQKAAGDPIAENGTRTVSAVLQPGTYTLYCPILDHREKGELTTFTVAAPERSGDDSGFDADTTRTGRDVPAPRTTAPTSTDGTGSRP